MPAINPYLPFNGTTDAHVNLTENPIHLVFESMRLNQKLAGHSLPIIPAVKMQGVELPQTPRIALPGNETCPLSTPIRTITTPFLTGYGDGACRGIASGVLLTQAARNLQIGANRIAAQDYVGGGVYVVSGAVNLARAAYHGLALYRGTPYELRDLIFDGVSGGVGANTERIERFFMLLFGNKKEEEKAFVFFIFRLTDFSYSPVEVDTSISIEEIILEFENVLMIDYD